LLAWNTLQGDGHLARDVFFPNNLAIGDGVKKETRKVESSNINSIAAIFSYRYYATMRHNHDDFPFLVQLLQQQQQPLKSIIN
jgi:hypothetical protein